MSTLHLAWLAKLASLYKPGKGLANSEPALPIVQSSSVSIAVLGLAGMDLTQVTKQSAVSKCSESANCKTSSLDLMSFYIYAVWNSLCKTKL